MRKVNFIWVFLLVAQIMVGVGCANTGVMSAINPEVGRPTNIILIGWDGAQREHVKECLARNELPNLKKLSEEGTIVAIDVLRKTDTKAGWAQILTGYEPEVTGVFSNSEFQPIPKGYTVFERLEEFFGPDDFVTVAVIGKKNNLGIAPPERVPIEEKSKKNKKGKKNPKKTAVKKKKKPQGKIITENGVKYRVFPGEPYYYTKDSMDVFINGLMEDEKVGSKTLELLEKYKDKPFFFFVHFAEVDHNGHKFGENSKEYNNALISADKWTGKIMEKLKELNLYDKTLIYVTADHGFDEGKKSHLDAPYIFLATNDKGVIRAGERADIAPTILERFGLDLSKIEPPLDGHSLTKPYNKPKW